MAGELNEKCAVAGAVGEDNVAPYINLMLFAMQHRGTEASGIVGFSEQEGLLFHRAEGLVKDVYTDEVMSKLQVNTAIGHNRYSTNGSKTGHAQPVKDGAVCSAVSLNGNLPQTHELDEFLKSSNVHTEPMNDAELVGHAIARSLRSGNNLLGAVTEAYPKMQGAFSTLAMHQDTIVAFRDPCGIRPLSWAKFDTGFAFASETSALNMVDPIEVGDVEPGQLIIASPDGLESIQFASPNPKLDIFENVYFARPDSQLYGQSVGIVRRNFGRELAQQHKEALMRLENPMILPVPETSTHAAEGVSEALGIPHRQSLVKNRYIGRTFIAPGHEERTDMIDIKHNMIPDDVEDLDIILVDDSIVRSPTIRSIVRKIREGRAKSVTVLVSSPPVRFPDFYGIDTPDQKELIAANMSIEGIRESIGADYLGYLLLSRLIKATGAEKDMFNLSCFNGVYPIEIGDEARKTIFEPKDMSMIDI